MGTVGLSSHAIVHSGLLNALRFFACGTPNGVMDDNLPYRDEMVKENLESVKLVSGVDSFRLIPRFP